MKIKNKKYRIRWDRVIALLIVLVAIIAAICYAIAGVISLFRSDDSNVDSEVIAVGPRQIDESNRMAQRIDSLLKLPHRLDTANIAVSVYDLTIQKYIYSLHDEQLLAPASCMKIPTAVAALKTLGMDHRYRTSLQVRGKMKGDTLVGNLLLVGDDDPLLENFNGLTSRLHRSGIRAIRGNIYYRLTREDTLRPHPSAKTWDIFYSRTPLMLKGKRYIQRDFMASLRGNGVAFVKDNAVKPDGQYRIVARESHLMRDVITPMLIHSSNIKAESVFYHLDYSQGLIPDHRKHWVSPHAVENFLRKTFCSDTIKSIGGSLVTESTHTMQGFVINDGSGLSPDNRLSASFLVDLLRYAYADKQLRDYFINEALASPGIDGRAGSLLRRMAQPQYRNRLYCKTGTIVTIGSSSLSGYLQGGDGHWYVFSIINSNSPVYESRQFQDRFCKMMMK